MGIKCLPQNSGQGCSIHSHPWRGTFELSLWSIVQGITHFSLPAEQRDRNKMRFPPTPRLAPSPKSRESHGTRQTHSIRCQVNRKRSLGSALDKPKSLLSYSERLARNWYPNYLEACVMIQGRLLSREIQWLGYLLDT